MTIMNRIFQGLQFYDCGTPVSRNVMDRFEKEHNLVLPDDYRQFLSEINGGVPTPPMLHFEDGDIEVREIFSLTECGDSNTWLTKLCAVLYFHRTPDTRSFFPIGCAEGSNYLYLSICPSYFGNIILGQYAYGWSDVYHEPYVKEHYLDYDFEEDVIAVSFTELLAKLAHDSDGHIE